MKLGRGVLGETGVDMIKKLHTYMKLSKNERVFKINLLAERFCPLMVLGIESKMTFLVCWPVSHQFNTG